ncbi:hypothetical protein SLEP1_g24317 [Rubroshorea leprosula]|uniref:Uncharacterized protein n=1 Tax=Rubroshorea leprosula TaxID=152421 RepID=A0AAV5JIC0_9ROSI|nr:hypothetical protein SLEP1_g24317 [Rubroshorea leprosula]
MIGSQEEKFWYIPETPLMRYPGPTEKQHFSFSFYTSSITQWENTEVVAFCCSGRPLEGLIHCP